MTDEFFLGIDPGSTNSAFAFYSNNTYIVFDEMDTATRRSKILEFQPKLCIIEKVNLMPNQGIVSGGKFMQSVGKWEGILETLDVPYQTIPPREWRKLANLTMPNLAGRSPNYKKKMIKEHLLNEARKRFPEADLKLKKYIDRAEALFMAFAAKRLYHN